MSNVNQVTVSGNLARDPKAAGENNNTVFLTIACNTARYDRDGQLRENVNYIPVVLNNGIAQAVLKTKKKGDYLLVSGMVETTSYAKNGQTVYETRVRGLNVDLGPRSNSSSQPQTASDDIQF